MFFDWRGKLVARAAPLDRLRDDRVDRRRRHRRSRPRRPAGCGWATAAASASRCASSTRTAACTPARASPVERWGAVAAHVGGEFLTTRGAGLVLGRERIRDGWLLAADAERFAWCGDGCERVQLWSGDDRRTLEPPRGVRPQPGPYAALSPDGRRLAISVTVGGKPRFAVVDLERDEWSIVPGARPGDYAALAWSPSGSWLYVAARDERLLASRGGTSRPIALPIDTGGTVMSIATAGAE